MNEFVAPVGVFVAVTVVAFAASVSLGMLLGVRLDRAMEARASAGDIESGPEQPAPAAESGRVEDRVE